MLGAAGVFLLLLHSYRRQDAQQNMFLLSLLLCLMSLAVPDAVVLFVVAWWLFVALRASNLRMYLASLVAILTVGLYFLIAWLLWPDSRFFAFEQAQWASVLLRGYCWQEMPLWQLIVAAVSALIGFVSMVAHFRNYPRANVRIQTRVLIAVPAMLLSLLSTVFPSRTGYSLWPLLALTALYLMGLYLITYGFPRLTFFARPHRAANTRRLSRKADSRNPFRIRKQKSYGQGRRSFSRSSRGRSRYSN